MVNNAYLLLARKLACISTCVYYAHAQLHNKTPPILIKIQELVPLPMSEPERELAPRESVVWGWYRFFDEVQVVQESIMRQYGTADERYAHFSVDRLSICVQAVSNVRDHLHDGESTLMSEEERGVVSRYVQMLDELVGCLRQLVSLWEVYIDDMNGGNFDTAYRAPLIRLAGRGRPTFDISREQLEYLASLSFTWSQIAALLGVSRMTIYRRREEFHMLTDISEQRMTNDEVKRHVTQMRLQSPNMGESMAIGRFRALGFQVTRDQVRRAIRETDPLNTALRWPGGLTRRRPYSVAGPNSLWHIG